MNFSVNPLDTDYLFDSQLLRQHILELEDTWRKTRILYDKVCSLETIEETYGTTTVRPLVIRASQLEEYYRQLTNGLELLCSDAEDVSIGFGNKLAENVTQVHNTLNKLQP